MKELEDHRWFPSVLRNFQTEFIGSVVTRFNLYKDFIKYFQTLQVNAEIMKDLCSGSGEPAITIFKATGFFGHLTLSDKYPNPVKYNHPKIFYEPRIQDVLTIEFKKETCYTMFNSFHHFSNKQKLEIVRKIQAAGAPAFLVEILEPGFTCFLKVLFTTTIGVLVLTPFIAPYSLKRFFYTYIIPVNVLTISYDGIISVIKSLSQKQYQKLFLGHDGVKIFRLTHGFSPLTIIQIQPKP